jgi:hypothetical protein
MGHDRFLSNPFSSTESSRFSKQKALNNRSTWHNVATYVQKKGSLQSTVVVIYTTRSAYCT